MLGSRPAVFPALGLVKQQRERNWTSVRPRDNGVQGKSMGRVAFDGIDLPQREHL